MEFRRLKFGRLHKIPYLCAVNRRRASLHRNERRTGDVRIDAGVVELARLESVYTSKGYRGFESPSLRKTLLIFNQLVNLHTF